MEWCVMEISRWLPVDSISELQIELTSLLSARIESA